MSSTGCAESAVGGNEGMRGGDESWHPRPSSPRPTFWVVSNYGGGGISTEGEGIEGIRDFGRWYVRAEELVMLEGQGEGRGIVVVILDR